MASAAERMKLTRRRRKRRVIPIIVEVSAQEIDFLWRRGYGARADDREAISQAVSSFLGDSLVDAMSARKHSTGSRRTLG